MSKQLDKEEVRLYVHAAAAHCLGIPAERISDDTCLEPQQVDPVLDRFTMAVQSKFEGRVEVTFDTIYFEHLGDVVRHSRVTVSNGN